jgi:type IV pilus assembly protein PilX
MKRHHQRGVVLVTSLIILVITSLLAIYMFGGFTDDEKISGNTREKARAVDAAYASLNQAQFWLGQPNNAYAGDWVTGQPCSANLSAPVVCSNALADPTTFPWAASVQPTLGGMEVNAAGGVGTYAEGTRYYIQYLGTVGVNPGSGMYRVTAAAVGGNANAVAVQQAVFQVSTDSQDIGGG